MTDTQGAGAPAITFRSLELAEPLLRTLDELGYEAPTPIQGPPSRCCWRAAT